MKSEEKTPNFDPLKHGDWSDDVEDVRRQVLSKIGETAPKSSFRRFHFRTMTACVALALIGVFAWIGLTKGPPQQLSVQGAPSANQQLSFENLGTSETALALAEAGPFETAGVVMKIITDDPNVIIFLVE